ncbi:MAG: hypothetical protein Q9191_007831, partial [Dirinaria sp. TL-2023a]
MPLHRFPPPSVLHAINQLSRRPSLLCRRCLAARQLSTSPPLLGRGGGGKKEQKRTVGINADKTKDEALDDALDFSGFQHAIGKATNHLKAQLSKLRTGGLDLEAIESLNVNINGTASAGGGGGGGSKRDGRKKREDGVVRLGDIAQVVPKGRTVVIIVGEKD